jgi:lysophospholipid acyltransferase (LPLAT)-like uncharacterized protein
MSEVKTEAEQPTEESSPGITPENAGSTRSLRREWNLGQRVQIWLISHLGKWVILLLGKTLQFESRGAEHLEEVYRAGHRAILTFWHNRILGATYYYRRRGIVVMSTYNFDGEYTSRCIQMMGYRSVRGSSTRGGYQGLLDMVKVMKEGVDAGFSIDGPHGPLYQAKVGPVLLARKTGGGILCFHLSYEKKWVIRGSWDQFQIPKPFNRVLLIHAPAIYVDRKADAAGVKEKLAEMQHLLEKLRDEGDAHWRIDTDTDSDPDADKP